MTAQKMTRYTKHIDADIAAAKNLNAAQMKKIGPGIGLNLIDITNFIVTVEPARLSSIMDILKEKNTCDLMHAIHMNMAEFPLLEKTLSYLSKRIQPAGANSVDTKKLTLCYLRLFSILAVKKLRFEQKLPEWLEKDRNGQSLKKSEIAPVIEKIREMYLMLVVLEARMQNMIPATEGLRIVRERVNVSV